MKVKPIPTTLYEFFFESGKLSEDAKNRLEGAEGMKKLKTGMRLLTPGSVWGVANDDLDRSMREILAPSFDKIIVAAWNARKEFRELADKSRKQPGTVLTWRSGKQKIHTDLHPSIELTLDGFSLPALEFTVSLVLAIQAIELLIQSAKVIAIRPGTVMGEASLKCGEIELCASRTCEVQLPGELSVPGGFPID